MLELLHELRSVPIPNPVLNSEDTSTGTGQAEGKEGARHKQELGRETGRQINASVAAKRKTGSQRSKKLPKNRRKLDDEVAVDVVSSATFENSTQSQKGEVSRRKETAMSSKWDQLHGQDYVSCCWQVLPVQGRAAKKEGQRKGEKREREIDRKREGDQ